MIRNFLSTPNILGRLMIVLLFAGGVVFAGAFDGFVVETQASSCCGGMDDAIFSSSSCCGTRTKSCRSDCNHGKRGECGPGTALCPDKGEEYEYTGQVEYCCEIDYNNDCEGS